jgi:hypothetical protein
MPKTAANGTQLQWSLMTKKRPSASQGVPPGKEALAWVSNTVTLISGVRDGELYDRMLEIYPDRVNPGSLWGAAAVAKAEP